MPKSRHPVFWAVWWASNVLLAVALIALVYTSVREFSMRRYLDGYSDAIVPNFLPAQEKVEAILKWMRAGEFRGVADDPGKLAHRDPQVTLNYLQLLRVCGTATNAFLNLARASDLQVRRLLLLSPDRNTKHVVAEVLIDQRWVIVDPAYRVMMKDAQGRLLTRKDLQNAALFEQAASAIPGYPREYSYERFAHVRLARLPLEGLHLRKVFDTVYPGWDEALDWSLLLERVSFLYLVLAGMATVFFLLVRGVLAWYADSRLRIPRFHLRDHMIRAGVAFFSTPEIKQ
ncbi:MAG TPA: transglutaminase domain-containing protein [Candidatus Angelobacter sp.]|nr:transglutaminase domain-containing protein [Candidatus Angelobacter sp.]